MEERIQKIISEFGYTSRRNAEILLKEGRVTVNGVVRSLGDKADKDVDEIAVDGNIINAEIDKCYLMLYKPRKYVTTLSDEHGRQNVSDLVRECGKRVWPVGRLDFESEGLLLLTNDGDLTNRLIHPSQQVEKEYYVWVTRESAEAQVQDLSKPMEIDGYRIAPAKVRMLSENDHGQIILSIVIHEGRNRQIRKMCGQCGFSVKRLKRVREGKLRLDSNLTPGQWRFLTEEELAKLHG